MGLGSGLDLDLDLGLDLSLMWHLLDVSFHFLYCASLNTYLRIHGILLDFGLLWQSDIVAKQRTERRPNNEVILL